MVGVINWSDLGHALDHELAYRPDHLAPAEDPPEHLSGAMRRDYFWASGVLGGLPGLRRTKPDAIFGRGPRR